MGFWSLTSNFESVFTLNPLTTAALHTDAQESICGDRAASLYEDRLRLQTDIHHERHAWVV